MSASSFLGGVPLNDGSELFVKAGDHLFEMKSYPQALDAREIQKRYYIQQGRRWGKTLEFGKALEDIKKDASGYIGSCSVGGGGGSLAASGGAGGANPPYYITTTGNTSSAPLWYDVSVKSPYIINGYSYKKEEKMDSCVDECCCTEDVKHCPLCDAKMAKQETVKWFVWKGKKQDKWRQWKQYTKYTFDCGTVKYEGDWDDRKVYVGSGCIEMPEK